MKQVFFTARCSHLCRVGQEKPVSLCLRQRTPARVHVILVISTAAPSVESHIKDVQYAPTFSNPPLSSKSPSQPNKFHLPVISHLRLISQKHMKLCVTLGCQTLPSYDGEIHHCHH